MVHSESLPVCTSDNLHHNCNLGYMSQALRQHNLSKHFILKTKGQNKIVPSTGHIALGNPMNKPVLKTIGSISSHVTDRSNAIKDPPRPSCKRVKLKQGSRKAKAFIIHDARNSDHLVIAITRIKTEGNVGMVVARVVVGCGQVDISSNTWIANDNGQALFTVGNAKEISVMQALQKATTGNS